MSSLLISGKNQMKKTTKTFIGGTVIGIIVGALVGGFTVASLMAGALFQLSIAQPVCDLQGQIITK